MLLKKIVIAEDDDAIAHMVNMALGDAGFLCCARAMATRPSSSSRRMTRTSSSST